MLGKMGGGVKVLLLVVREDGRGSKVLLLFVDVLIWWMRWGGGQ